MSKKDKPPPPIVLRVPLVDKPDLVVHAADLTVTARALAKLLAEQCVNLFVHSRRPVLVLPADQDGAPTMHPVTCNEVIIAAHKLCQPVKRKTSGGDRDRSEVTLPKQVAELYLAMPDEWRLRPLISFVNGPMLRDDGTIHCENGYDALTGVYTYNVPKIMVPDSPSREDAERAFATLRHPYRTFAFADRTTVDEAFQIDGAAINVPVTKLDEKPGKDESAFLVGLLTAVCRPSLLIAPAIAVRSPSLSGSGVGKKLLLQSVAIIAFGREAPSVALGRGNEFEKGLVAAVIRPDPGVVIDNINGRKLQSETLCTVLTDRPAMVRVLGASELKEANPRMLICIDGNAFTFAEDLVRRNFVVEMDAKVENPELRKFAGDFLADITAQRTQMLQAALTIWRWGRQNAATLKRGQRLGGFEQWGAWARDPLLALGCQDPVAKIAKLKAADPVRLAKAEALRTWWQHHGKDKVTANDLHEAVKALLEPDLAKRTRQNIASLVSRLDGTRLAGFHLASNKDDDKKGYWTPISYWLERVEDENQQTTNPSGDIKTPPEPEPEPEAAAAAASSEEDEPDPVRPAPAASAMPPEACVAIWRDGCAALNPQADPCPGWRPGEWPRVHAGIKQFLAGPHALAAARAGWSAVDLFGVHRTIGVAARDCVGALTANSTNGFVCRVEANGALQFANGTKVQKRPLDSNVVPIWNFRAPTTPAAPTPEEASQ